MQTKDHLSLGHFLLSLSNCEGLHKHKTAFLVGCVEPDYNILTYMRGMKAHKKFRGHNAKNSLAKVSKFLTGFQKGGLHSMRDFFKLGIMLHYVADAFTWPHNEFWQESMLEHMAYEKRMHELFTAELKAKAAGSANSEPTSLLSYFHSSHEAYSKTLHKMKTDCQYIIRVCETMLLGSLRYAAKSVLEKSYLREVNSYEGAYHHGLV